ncbi:MAG: hypothetical protein LBE21_01535 [Pseudomonadales bacterium]|jgi:Tfp pilus assembly protein PilX|nr:hypothetical protein [Pseudomonadales bacterium]
MKYVQYKKQRGALLLVVLLALAALTLLGGAALQAALLQGRMASNAATRQALFAAADHALAEVERQLYNAVLADNQSWLQAAAEGQTLALPGWNLSASYNLSACCDSAWDAALPLEEGNSAVLHRLSLWATSTQGPARVSLQSAYLIAPAGESSPARARRVAWRRFDF